MIYDQHNAMSATVHDVESRTRINRVLWIDADKGEIHCADHPYRAVGDKIATHLKRFKTVHPIFGGQQQPCMFHCYGRLG